MIVDFHTRKDNNIYNSNDAAAIRCFFYEYVYAKDAKCERPNINSNNNNGNRKLYFNCTMCDARNRKHQRHAHLWASADNHFNFSFELFLANRFVDVCTNGRHERGKTNEPIIYFAMYGWARRYSILTWSIQTMDSCSYTNVRMKPAIREQLDSEKIRLSIFST